MLKLLFALIVATYGLQALIFLARFAKTPAPGRRRRRGRLVNVAHCLCIAALAGFMGRVIPRPTTTLVLGVVFSVGLVSLVILLRNEGLKEVPALVALFRRRR